MPTPVARQQAHVCEVLNGWVARRIARDARIVGEPLTPQGQGNANETVLFTMQRSGIEERLVMRIAATSFQVFLDASLIEQYQILEALGSATSLPVPRVRWFEDDDSYFGAQFFVMDAIEGRVPPDQPSYNCDGTWTASLTAENRHRLWVSALDALCAIHTDPGAAAAGEILSQKLDGRDGLQEQMDYWARYVQWAGGGSPLLDETASWLADNRPANPILGLSWGDARMENMIFDADLTCAAILDWEMASLGGPLMDLGWWLFCDTFAEMNYATPRLTGFGDRTETCQRWLARTAIAVDDLGWYEIFAGYRMSAIIMRMMRAWRDDFGLELPADFNDVDNSGTRLLAQLLAATKSR